LSYYADSIKVYIDPVPVSIKSAKGKTDQLIVYPNPFDQNFVVMYNNASAGDVQISIMDMMGAVLQEEKFLNQNKGVFKQNIVLKKELENVKIVLVKITVGDDTYYAKMLRTN